TTTLSLAAGGPLRMGSRLRPAALLGGVGTFFDQLAAMASVVSTTFTNQPSSANRLVELLDPDTGDLKASGSSDGLLSTLVPRASLADAIRRLFSAYSEAGKVDGNRQPDAPPVNVALVGLGVSADWSAEHTVMVRRPDGTTQSGGSAEAYTRPSGGSSAPAAPGPTLTSVAPAVGPTTGTHTVTITGTNLFDTSAVTFGAQPAVTFVANSDTQVVAEVPAAAAGTVDVTVTTPGGQRTLVGAYSYVAAPTISSLSSSAGPTIGGNTITITGTNLTGVTGVTFGSTSATNVTVVSATVVSATVPAGAVGAVMVKLSKSGVESNGLSYTYAPMPDTTSVSPGQGVAAGGTTVTITGSNLTGATSVTFGTVPATGFTVVSPTQIVAIAPAGTGTVGVTVATPIGSVTLGGVYTYIPAPSLTALSPSSGTIVGGTTVTITGLNLTGATSVTFGTTSAASFTVVSATQLSVIVPAGAPNAPVDVTVTTPGGTSNAMAYTYLMPPQIHTMSVFAGPTSGGNPITITGLNLGPAASVTFGGVPGEVVSSTASQVVVIAPAGAAGPVMLTVTSAAGSATSAYTYVTPGP
ncbi:MAG: IPT/TIG domain-containing protein, partial [Candidatus Sericytochromatia bacterium]